MARVIPPSPFDKLRMRACGSESSLRAGLGDCWLSGEAEKRLRAGVGSAGVLQSFATDASLSLPVPSS
ncbi:MAG: hypothetical protein RLO21_08920 [Nitratireductor sp.]